MHIARDSLFTALEHKTEANDSVGSNCLHTVGGYSFCRCSGNDGDLELSKLPMARISSLFPLQVDMKACDAKEKESDYQRQKNERALMTHRVRWTSEQRTNLASDLLNKKTEPSHL